MSNREVYMVKGKACCRCPKADVRDERYRGRPSVAVSQRQAAGRVGARAVVARASAAATQGPLGGSHTARLRGQQDNNGDGGGILKEKTGRLSREAETDCRCRRWWVLQGE